MEQKIYTDVDRCINLFKNGEERYKKSPTFNNVIQMLIRNENPFEVIDFLCLMLDDQSKAFEQYIIRDTRPMITKFNNL